MNTHHLNAFLEALHQRDVATAKTFLADDVVIRSPIVPEPFQGKEKVAEILAHLVNTVDAFEPQRLLQDGSHFVAVFTIRFGANVLDGMDHLHVNDAGLIDSMTVAWRPLPTVVQVQQQLAPKLGGQALKLVPVEQAS